MSQKTIRKKPRLNHRARFHILCRWLLENFEPCTAADVGGGKGLLAYLLNQNNWKVSVIDPFYQELPRTFKDLGGSRTTLNELQRNSVNRISLAFEKEMAKDYDLLIGLHAHGSNLKIIDACKKYNKSFVLVPCCVVDEPIVPQPNINWLDSLVTYAKDLGFDMKKVELNIKRNEKDESGITYKGQNIVIFSRAINE